MGDAAPREVRSMLCLLNPKARQGSRRDEIEKALASRARPGVDVRLSTMRPGQDVTEIARRAAEDVDLVVGVGGDGTLSAVARGLLGTRATLGVLPMGTLNHFAKDLGIPLEIDAAVGVLFDGATRRVDVGDAGGHAFLNTATLGVHFDVVRARERWTPRIGKWPAAVVATIAVCRHFPVLKLDVDVDGRRVRSRMPLLWIGNNAYSESWPDVGTRQRLDEGCLTVVMVHEAGRWALIRQVARVLRGRADLAEDIDLSCAKAVSISSRAHHLRVALDGELVVLRGPLGVTVRPQALAVRVPSAAAATTGAVA